MNIENLNRARNAALAFILAAGLSLPTAGLAYAASDDDSDDISTKVKDKLNNLFNEDSDDENVAKKTESVYVFTKADGTVKNTVVSDWLKNADKDTNIYDISSLTNIENTEGKETYEAKGESLVWDAQGSDIYYQGDSDREAPISLKITYWVDGEKVPADQMAGKSGHVKIRYDFTNNSYSTEYVDGAARTIYTPFFCVTGMILDNDVFSNITTDNAKVMNDGDRSLVGGYALPGLQEDLDVDPDDYEFPTYFEIEADVEDFELSTTATLVTSGLFDDLNTDELDDSDIQDALDDLADAMDQLIDGTSELYDGMKQLDDGGKQLAEGTTELADATADLPESAQALADGSASLASGLVDAVKGAEQLKDGNSQITDGLDQLVNGTDTSTGLVDALEGVQKLQAGVKQLQQGVDGDGTSENPGMTATLNTVSYYLSQIIGDTTSGLTYASSALSDIDVDALSTSLTNLGTAAKGASDNAGAAAKDIDDAINKLDPNTDAGAITLLQKAKDEANGAKQYADAITDGLGSIDTSSLSQLKQLQQGLDAAVSSLNQVNDAITQLIQGSEKISAGDAQVQEGLEQLLNGYEDEDENGKTSSGLQGAYDGANKLLEGNQSVDDGLDDLSDGLSSASSGANDLADGLDQLNQAVPALAAGITALKEGSVQLSDGIGEAKDGTKKLKEGIEEFNDEGIQKIIDAYDDNVAGLTDRLKATAEAGKAYDNFSGKSDSMKGSVKFVYETDAIEIDDDDDDDD